MIADGTLNIVENIVKKVTFIADVASRIRRIATSRSRDKTSTSRENTKSSSSRDTDRGAESVD